MFELNFQKNRKLITQRYHSFSLIFSPTQASQLAIVRKEVISLTAVYDLYYDNFLDNWEESRILINLLRCFTSKLLFYGKN